MANLKDTIVLGKLNVTDKVIADKLIKLGGTSNQVLLANGDVVTKSQLVVGGGGVTSITQDSNDGHKLIINTGGTTTTITIPDDDTTYSAAGSSLGLVKSGGDVTISSGVITVSDDSHNHVISNVDGLQDAIDDKQNILVSGTTIKTINDVSILGSGNIEVGGVGWSGTGTGAEKFNFKSNEASGSYSHAEGHNTTASGYRSHAEGSGTTAFGGNSHAEGDGTTTCDYNSHAEGEGYIFSTAYAFIRTSTRCQYTSTTNLKNGAVLTNNNGTYATITAVSGTNPYTYTFDTDFVTTEGGGVSLYRVVGVAYGRCSHTEGYRTTASGDYSHAAGNDTIASGDCSHAEGQRTTASDNCSHAEGDGTTASGDYGSHAEGYQTTASGGYSHAEGNNTIASGDASHAEGYHTIASGDYSHAAGYYTIANNYQYAIGCYNRDTTAKTRITDKTTSAGVFIVGIGTSTSARSNGFRVNPAGNVYGVGSFNTSGADYAEYFEWLDGNPNNEDRRGRFVTLDEDKIRYATIDDDYILGVVSAEPSVAGDVHSEEWHNRYLRDIFGNKIVEVVEVEETTDEHGEIIPAHTERRWVLNPNYDSNANYTSREERPEWSAVGLMGKLVVVDDGTCQINGYCYPKNDGIATFSKEKTNYRVMKRLDDTHIKVLVK